MAKTDDALIPDRSEPHRPGRHPRRAVQGLVSGIWMDRILARSIAVMCIVFGAQGVPFALMQVDVTESAWSVLASVAVYGGFVATAVVGLAGRRIESFAAFVAIAYVVAMITWPLAVRDPHLLGGGAPWLWYVCNLALAAASVAFSPLVAAIYLVVVPTVYAFIQVTPSGGSVPPDRAILSSLYVVILGGAVLILVTLLRRAAADVDTAQSSAITRYTRAVREHATEVERVQVDSIVHDSVLTTFLSVARAEGEHGRRLATVMAKNTLTQLSESIGESRAGEVDTLAAVHARLVELGREMQVEVRSPAVSLPNSRIPTTAAEALHSASVQALVNSFQHAGGPDVERWVAVRGDEGMIHVEVGDTGRGFDLATMTEGRLGVRVSIQTRLANAGGAARIASAPGTGTVISLTWPAPAAEPESVVPA